MEKRAGGFRKHFNVDTSDENSFRTCVYLQISIQRVHIYITQTCNKILELIEETLGVVRARDPHVCLVLNALMEIIQMCQNNG